MIRIAGLILFICYLLGLTYFLFFAESYGRTVTDREYSYNLVPFLEIKRFWQNRKLIGHFAVFINLAGNVLQTKRILYISMMIVAFVATYFLASKSTRLLNQSMPPPPA